MYVLDVHVGQTDVPTESPGDVPPGDVPRRCLPPSLISPDDGELVRTPAMNFPRTSVTPGELCTMDVGFRPYINIPRTSSNPSEKSAGELGYRSVLGFSQVDSAQSRCGAVELGLRRVNCPPGEIGAKECDYIMPALLARSSDLECLPYQGKDCIKDFSAGGTLFPSVSDLSGPRGPFVTDGPVGHPGTLSPSTFMMEMTARQLLCPPVVAQTRPMEGCDPALPRRWRRGRGVLTEDSAVVVDAERVSAASDAVVSRETHKYTECVPTVVPKLAAAPQAASEVVQPRPPDSGCTDLLPPVGECRESLGRDTPDAVESGMEVAGGIPPAEIDISVNLDMLQTATSVTTEVSDQEWMEIDTPDPVESGMETTGGSPPAVSDISVNTDGLQTAISVTTQVSEKWMIIDSPDAVESGMEMAGGSPPAEFDISVGPDVILTAISVTTAVSEKWMERFVIYLDMLCSDGLASGGDPAKESSDVGSDVCMVSDSMPTVISVTTIVPEKRRWNV